MSVDLLRANSVSTWPEARCNDGTGSLVELFFSEELSDIAEAKEICSDCLVRGLCLSGARLRKEPWGVWGGELFVNGRVLTVKRKRGRPPKVPQVGRDCA